MNYLKKLDVFGCICVSLTLLIIPFLPAIFKYADVQRGYDATGGEIFIPLFPLIIWLIVKMLKDMFKEIKRKD